MPPEVLDIMAESQDRSVSKPEQVSVKKLPLKLSPKAQKIIEENFCFRDEKGGEDIEGVFNRVARCVAMEDVKYDPMNTVDDLKVKFFNMMASFRFFPEPSIFKNIGRSENLLSSTIGFKFCHSLDSVFEVLRQALKNNEGSLSFNLNMGDCDSSWGCVQVSQLISVVVRNFIKNSSANDFCFHLRIDNPEWNRFMMALKDNEEVANNLIVGIPNAPIGDEVLSHLVSLIQKNKTFIFVDRIEEANPTPLKGKLEITNKEGDMPLLPLETCSRGVINLSVFVRNQEVLWGELLETIHGAVRFLDNVVSANHLSNGDSSPLPVGNRKISLGVMGWADFLVQMGVGYRSKQALEWAQKIMLFIQQEAEKASMNLAADRGAFTDFNQSMLTVKARKRRHATVTGIMKTNLVSAIADCSKGIEPLHSISFGSEENPSKIWNTFKESLEKHGVLPNMFRRLIESQGNLRGMDDLSEEIREIFITKNEIFLEDHLAMQEAFQKYTENGVYKEIPIHRGISKERLSSFLEKVLRSKVKSVHWAPVELFQQLVLPELKREDISSSFIEETPDYFDPSVD